MRARDHIWLGLVPLVLALVGCSADAEFVRAPEGDWPFFIIVEAEGRAPEASGPHRFDMDESALRFAVNGVERINVLTVDLETLLAPYVIDASSIIDRVELRMETETCEGGAVSSGGLRLPIDSDLAQMFGLVAGSFTARPLTDLPLSLWFPRNEDNCFDTAPLELSPFGAEWRLLAPGPVPGRPDSESSNFEVRSTRLLPSGHALVRISESDLLLLRPGEDLNQHPERYWTAAQAPDRNGEPGRWRMYDFDVRETEDGARLTVGIVMGWFSRSSGGFGGSTAFDLEWTESGFGSLVVRLESSQQFRFIDVDASGRWIVGGDEGQLYVRGSTETGYQSAPAGLGLPAQVEFVEWAASSIDVEPDVLVDSAATFYFGDLGRGTPVRAELDTWGKFQGDLSALGSAEGLDLFWSGATPQYRHRTASGQRLLITGYLPPDLSACGEPPDACGRQDFSLGTFMPLAQTPYGTLVFGSTACEGLVEYHPVRGCSRAIQPPSSMSATDGPHRVTSLSAAPAGLLVGGEATGLLFAPWPR